MKLSNKQQAVVDIIQWILIGILIMLCALSYFHKRDENIQEMEERTEETYRKIYESQEIETLKKRNRELYDSIRVLENAETAISIKYVYKHTTDTIYVDKFVQREDSVYHYVADNDTIRNEMFIRANDLQWVQHNFSIHDSFMIVNSEKDGHNQLTINHSPNVEISDVDVWHRTDKKKWTDRFKVGPQVGIGYGIFNNKPDVYVGIGVTYEIGK